MKLEPGSSGSPRKTLEVAIPPPPSEDSAEERAAKRQRRVSFRLLPPKMETIEGTPERKSVGKGKAKATDPETLDAEMVRKEVGKLEKVVRRARVAVSEAEEALAAFKDKLGL